MTPLQILINARDLLPDERHWSQRCTGVPLPDGTTAYCAAGAIWSTATCVTYRHVVEYHTYQTAEREFKMAAGCQDIPYWNDDALRTYADVIETFNIAIARLQLAEQGSKVSELACV